MQHTKSDWKPLLQEEIIRKRIDIIAYVLETETSNFGYSLLTGNTGIALFNYYNWLYTGNEKYFEKGNNLILEIFGLQEQLYNRSYSLCNGTAGFMWTINHLIRNEFIEGDCNELFSEKEPYLYSLAQNDMKEGRYDFLHNALGAGLYFINQNDTRSIGYAGSLITELEKTAEKDASGLKWRSVYKTEEGLEKEVYNIGISHGIASIVACLTKAYKNNILKSETKDLLTRATAFLISTKADTPCARTGSFFPSFIFVNEDNKDSSSRLAWCYGDLGIGIVLWHASQALQNAEWEKIAIDVLLQTTSRKDPVKEFVNNPGICHGSAGIAHIYNRMYQYTGIETFKDSAIYWLHDTLNKAVFKDGLAGYKMWRPGKSGGYFNEAGILEGIAGIGLVLIAAATNTEPKWDECFLLS